MRTRATIGLLLLGIAGSSAEPLQAQEDQIGSRGFSADKVYNIGDIDSVSLFNGNLTVTIPLGLTYPVGENLSYGFSATYNSLVWEVDEYFSIPEDENVTAPVLSTLWNAGAGWMVSPGRLFEPNSGPENPPDGNSRWLFVDPAGAKHWFYDALHPGVLDGSSEYTADSTYLRMREISATERVVEFPDGSVTLRGPEPGRRRRLARDRTRGRLRQRGGRLIRDVR